MIMLDGDYNEFKAAVGILEHPDLCDRITRLIGMPMDKAISMVPSKWMDKLSEITMVSLEKAFDVVLLTVNTERLNKSSHKRLHKALALATGSIAGLFGGWTAAIEMPITTGIMMRAIADIAISEGEDLTSIESKLACLQVLAISNGRYDGLSSSGSYYYLRRQMDVLVDEAAEFITVKGFASKNAPQIVKLMTVIAERLGIVITEKFAGEIIPVIGAGAGAAINYMFIEHFQRIAKAHFTIRRLERKYDELKIKEEYERILHQFESENSYKPLKSIESA